MEMHGGLELARPRPHRRWWKWLAAAVLAAALLWGGPRLAAALPAGAVWLDETLGRWFVSQYQGRLEALQQQNAALHRQLAAAEAVLAENEALRSLLDCNRVTGRWQPARAIVRQADSVTLNCAAEAGAPVVDPLGRYAGRVIADNGNDTCTVAFAGSEKDPCAGLSGAAAGLLERRGHWLLTDLSADCGLAAGAVVTTPGGYWLGTLAAAPEPEEDGLTATAPLTDTADLDSTVFFVKNS